MKRSSGIIRQEILNNLREIKYRIHILGRLIPRYFLKNKGRTPGISLPEYDNYWDGFWEKKDIFRKDLTIVKNDVVLPGLSPFEFKKKVIVNILAEKIASYKLKTVLEIGSGAGLNLLLLAPLFPEVSFYGLEPTNSGVRVSNNFIKSPPKEFEEAFKLGELKNVQIIKGSILEEQTIAGLREKKIDFVYTCAVLEQLNNYLDIVFPNIFSLSEGYFLFYEEWLEGNYLIDNYKTLVDADYFRISWNYLNQFKEIETLERSIPLLQPSWLKYSVVFAKKQKDCLGSIAQYRR